MTGAVALVAGAIVLGSVSAAQADHKDSHAGNTKWFVCKFVGTPGVDERLQTGQNPISVAASSINHEDPDSVGVGDEFADAHGRSVVIVEDTGQDEPDPSVCQPIGPTAVTPQVAPSDPCGTVNDTVVVTADPSKFSYVVSGSRATGFSVDFTALTGYTISGGDPRVIPASAFTDVPCPITAVAPTVSASEACDVEGTYTVPATAGVQYLLDGAPIAAGTYEGPESGTVTAQAVAPATLTNPAFSFALDLDPAEACEVLGVDEEEPKKPKPPKEPVDEPEVLGSEEAVPTAVDAGLLGLTGADSSSNGLLGAALVAGGLLMLSYAGLVTRGRSRRGAHQF